MGGATSSERAPGNAAFAASGKGQGEGEGSVEASAETKATGDVTVADQSTAVESVSPESLGGDATSSAAVMQLSSEYRSQRALAEAVLRAVAANDAGALDRLRVGRAEYLTLLWPEFPQARDPRHTLKPEFHWGLLDSTSVAGERDILQDYGGMEFELLEVRPTKAATRYETFVLHKVELRVRRRSDNREGVLRFLGSIVERDGHYKLLSYPS